MDSAAATTTKTIRGVRVPSIGLGTVGLTGEAGTRTIRAAIELGYRHIDTAIRYGNEREVGDAIRASGIARDELFVTTKIWYTDLSPDLVRTRVGESLERLQLDHVDLLLIHWPSADTPLGETLAAFGEERAAGRTRQIGVSNFTVALMREAVETHGADIFANQVEYHPFLAQKQVLSRTAAAGMMLTAYLPLARGKVFDDPVLQGIGRRHGKSAGQVALRWLIQQDNLVAIPHSTRLENQRSNLDVFDFVLEADEMAAIARLDRQERQIDLAWAPAWDRG